MICDAETEIPVSLYIAPGNRHDSAFFARLFDDLNQRFCITYGAKYLADSAFDATHIYKELHENGVKAAITANGRGHRKSEVPKDPEYKKRWAIERIFSMLKEVFGLAKNRVIRMKKVAIHIHSCITAYLASYLM